MGEEGSAPDVHPMTYTSPSRKNDLDAPFHHMHECRKTGLYSIGSCIFRLSDRQIKKKESRVENTPISRVHRKGEGFETSQQIASPSLPICLPSEGIDPTLTTLVSSTVITHMQASFPNGYIDPSELLGGDESLVNMCVFGDETRPSFSVEDVQRDFD